MYLSMCSSLKSRIKTPYIFHSIVFSEMEKKYKAPKFSDLEITNKWHEYVKFGHSELIAEIYENSKEIIYFAAYKIHQDKALALDTTQEVFVFLISNRDNKRAIFEKVRSFHSWISAVTRNAAIKRNKSKYEHVPITEFEEDEKPDESKDLHEREKDIEILYKAISELKKKNFAKIIKLELKGMSNDMIAKTLNRSEEYVRNRKYLAKQELKRAIKSSYKKEFMLSV